MFPKESLDIDIHKRVATVLYCVEKSADSGLSGHYSCALSCPSGFPIWSWDLFPGDLIPSPLCKDLFCRPRFALSDSPAEEPNHRPPSVPPFNGDICLIRFRRESGLLAGRIWHACKVAVFLSLTSVELLRAMLIKFQRNQVVI